MRDSENHKAHVLIVDDQSEIRDILCGILCGSYTCVTAGSAEEALSILGTQNIDLLLSDIKMGGMSGLEMIPHALKSSPDTVIMMISGEQTIDSAIKALRLGAFDYITKPFDIEHVEAGVDRAFKHQSLLVTKRRYENHLEEVISERTAERDYLAYHDALTDLPNRALFHDRLAQALAGAQQNHGTLAVGLLSLDQFKNVNDTLGHGLARQLLQLFGKRVKETFTEAETLARFEADEFALLLQVRDAADALDAVQRFNDALRLPFEIEGHEIFVTLSMGIALFPDDGSDLHVLLTNAGSALNRAREQDGNSCGFYTADMNAKALQHLRLENNLRRALERTEFEVYYQPQVKVETRQIVGMEALARWHHPDFGLVSPTEFIPLAESSGLIVPIGEWVLRAVCRQSKSWQDDGLIPLPIAVNISARQFQQGNLAEVVVGILQETGMDPQRLEIELTESSIMKSAASAAKTLDQLQAIGIKISIDDFGTGYSSLARLKRLPIDVLKIDQSFVRDLNTDPDDAVVVRAIITLAHNLGLKVIAEGVETEAQLGLLHLLKCDGAQGYLFGKPAPADECRALLAWR
ncbi:MAG TPA: EAL domain-containing protein [Pyrinomonadaceae bacterium]|jgi:diguanylate cyclase (GGDEF)-like protein|nr:EAL domain-containing protein [Pyrinomonadaceae bacterium]